jgi:hypothetical protein
MIIRIAFFRSVLPLVFVLLLASCGGSAETIGTTERGNQPGDEDPTLGELLSQLELVEEKVLGLAGKFETAEYEWHPDEGARSGAEVFMHLVTINFVFPIFAGHPAPLATGLTIEDLDTAAPAFEGSLHSKEEILPELGASFAHLRRAIESTSAQDLENQVTLFGNSTTVRAFWIDHVGHLREHLGQLIAYGRTNGVAPPWS